MVEGRGDSGRGGYNRPSSDAFSRFFGGLLVWSLRGIVVLIVLGLMVGVGFAAYRGSTTGATEAWTSDLSVALDNKVDTTPFLAWFDTILNPAKARTYKSIVEKNEDNDALGVKILKFEGTPTEYFMQGDVAPPIQSTAIVEAGSLDEKGTLVNFTCELEDYSGDIEVLPAERTFPGTGRPYSETVFCTTLRGGPLSLQPRILNTKKMTFNVLFDSLAIAHYDAYIMKRSHYELAFSDKDDLAPFIHFLGSKPEKLGPGNIMQSRTTDGPINLGMGTGNPQPFLDGDLVLFQVSLTPRWRGELKYVRSLTLKVPPEIELDENPLFCDFESTGEYEGEYKLYSLTDYALNEKVNVDCSSEAIEGTGLSEASCMEHFKTNLQLKCGLQILPFVDDSTSFLRTPIEAELDYVYELDKSINIKIRGAEGVGGDNPCAYYDEQECMDKQMCEPNPEDVIECSVCDEQRCEDYNEEDCAKDYCKFGSCSFDDGSCKTNVIS
jgi:hypothetical protein